VRRLREPPAQALQQTPVFEYPDWQGHLGGILPFECPLEHHANQLPNHALVFLVRPWLGLEGFCL